MRIAIVINTSWNIYNFRRSLIEALQKAGHEVIAIAPKDAYSERLEALGVRHFHIPLENKGTNPIKELFQIRTFYNVYKLARPDVVLQYTIKPNIYGALAAKLLKIPSINNVSGLGTVFLHDNLVSKLAQRLYRFAFRYPKVVFFQNPDDKQEFISRNLVDENKCDLLPGSGIQLDKYLPSPLPENEETTFIFIARLLFDKGTVEFLEAAREVKKSSKSKFVVCGKIETDAGLGIQEEELKQYIDDGTVEYLGHIDNVPDHIKSSHCVVLPSYREGTPRTLLEAAALGRPIIATNVPGCKEVVKHTENGYLCEVKNSKRLAEAMHKFAKLNREEKEKMGAASRRLVESKFDDKFVIEKYLLHLNALKA